MKLMIKLILLIYIFGGELSITNAQGIKEINYYLGQKPPGEIPQIFNLGISDKKSFTAERIAISRDQSEIYYMELDGYPEMDGLHHTMRTKRYIFKNEEWIGPETVFEGYGSPSFSKGGDTLFLQNKGLENAYICVRQKDGWTKPRRILSNLKNAHYLQETDKGNFFAATIPMEGPGAVDRTRLIFTKQDTMAASLNAPVNSKGNDLDFFVARDESYIIFVSQSRLKITFCDSRGNWSNPADLGSKINFGLAAWGPYVTYDNKYLFYTTGTKPDYSDTRIYWVRIDGLFERLKNNQPVK